MTLALEIPVDDRYVGLARHLAAQAARRSELSEDRIDDVRVAVSEVVASAFASERTAGVTEPIRIEIGIGDRFAVAVLDRGAGIDRSMLEGPMAGADEPGLGLLITQALVDEFIIEDREGGGSRVVIGLSAEPPDGA